MYTAQQATHVNQPRSQGLFPGFGAERDMALETRLHVISSLKHEV